MDQIVELEELKAIENVEQVEAFRTYTNNFTNLEKLKPEEVLYLNLCTWLDPKARAINEALKNRGGITLVDSNTGASAFFEKYDLFHSLLGEMSPGAVADRIKGGHLYIQELKAAILDTGKIKSLGNGFFDMEIQYIGKQSAKYKQNSFFPMGTSVEQAVDMIEKTIANPRSIECAIVEGKKYSAILTGYSNQIFNFNIEKNIAKFHPMSPDALKKIL